FIASTSCLRSSVSVRVALASTRSATTILPPSWPNRLAAARPIPCPAPVTRHPSSFSLPAPAARASSSSAMNLSSDVEGRIEPQSLRRAAAQNSKTRSTRASLDLNRSMGHAFLRLHGVAFGRVERCPHGQNKRCRAHAVALGIEAGRLLSFLQIKRRLTQTMPRHDNRVAGRDQILGGAVLDRTHALLHGCILHSDTNYTAISTAALLCGAIDHVVVVLVDDRPERPRNQLDVGATATPQCVALDL